MISGKSTISSLKFLFLLISCLLSVHCNLFNINHPHKYLTPPFENNFENSNPPLLPEIIINKRLPIDSNHLHNGLIRDSNVEQNGYNYEKPNNQYLTPTHPPLPPSLPPQLDQPIKPENEYLPPQVIFPIQMDEEHKPPSENPPQNYLPPSVNLRQSSSNEIFINFPKHENKIDTEKQDKKISLTKTQNGYNYPIPPLSDEEQDNEGYVYPFPPSSTYLPPNNVQGRFLKEQSSHGPLRLELKELRCLNQVGGYFRAVINVQSYLDNIPVIDFEIIDDRCEIKIIRNQLVFSVSFNDFRICGVKLCGDDLCIRLRFPLIRGMKTSADSILTLQCKVQERIVAKTHSLKLGLSELSQQRNVGTFAQGGSQQPFRTHIVLYRRADGDESFVHPVVLQPGGIVQLGEDLILRSHVNSGDGWNYTRISDVNLQRLSPSGDVINSASLILSNGCLNPIMKAICPYSPIFEPPLGHRVQFKAIMFQGMKSGDEITISVRVIGCLERRDCFIDPLHCDKLTAARNKRNIITSDISDISRLSFRIEIPESEQTKIKQKNLNQQWTQITIAAISCLLCLFVLVGFVIKNRKKIF